MDSTKIGKQVLNEALTDIYEFLMFLCEKFDDDYKQISINLLQEWRETNTQMYGYKVLDNIKNNLTEKLKNEGIPFISYDINNENLACFVVPAAYVQQLETFSIELAKEKEKVAETTLDAINDYCFGSPNKQRNTVQITGKEIADRLLQNLSKSDKGEGTVLFNREIKDEEKQIYLFHFPENETENVNRRIFQSLWELSCPLSEEIEKYDHKDLSKQSEIRKEIGEFFDKEESQSLYIFNAVKKSNACIKISKDKIEYLKDGVNITEGHPCIDNEETHEIIERLMDSFENPFLVKESDLERADEIKEKELRGRKEYFKEKTEYINSMKDEKTVEKNLSRCFKDELNSRSIQAIKDYMKEYDRLRKERDNDYQPKLEKMKECLESIETSRHYITVSDLSYIQRTKTIDKNIEKEMDKEIERFEREKEEKIR